MGKNAAGGGAGKGTVDRRERLAAELRANLRKRKERSRSEAVRSVPSSEDVGPAPDCGEESDPVS